MSWVEDCVVKPNDPIGEMVVNTRTGMSFDWEIEGYSKFARRFDEKSVVWDHRPGINRNYILEVLSDCNEELNRKGFLYLDDVYSKLGFETDESTYGIGWFCFEESEVKLVDFGISRLLTREEIDFMNNRSTRVVLDFNVDGYIQDIIY